MATKQSFQPTQRRNGGHTAPPPIAPAAGTAPPRAPVAAARAPSADQIAERAYQIWQESGRPEGKQQEHWYQAERELRGLTTGAKR